MELCQMNRRTAFVNFIASVFIFLFTYTAVSKLTSFSSFRYNISRSPLIGNYGSFIVVVLPAVELAITIFLFFPRTRLAGIYASFCLMAIFSFYVGYGLLSGSPLPCTCGGIIQSLTWQQHLWLNAILTVLSVIAIRLKVSAPQQKLNVLLQ